MEKKICIIKKILVGTALVVTACLSMGVMDDPPPSYRMMEVVYVEISEKLANFALQIKEAFMEPTLHDGDIVIVRHYRPRGRYPLHDWKGIHEKEYLWKKGNPGIH